MREHILGRTPRLTAYFCGIAAGLALFVAGLEATRVLLVGEFSPVALAGYAAVGGLGGLFLSFVTGYLNGGILASWAAGSVPAAGRAGPPLAEGRFGAAGAALLSAAGVGILLGAAGFALAVEKHRRDALSADLPDPPSRAALLWLVGLSALLGGCLLAASVAV